MTTTPSFMFMCKFFVLLDIANQPCVYYYFGANWGWWSQHLASHFTCKDYACAYHIFNTFNYIKKTCFFSFIHDVNNKLIFYHILYLSLEIVITTCSFHWNFFQNFFCHLCSNCFDKIYLLYPNCLTFVVKCICIVCYTFPNLTLCNFHEVRSLMEKKPRSLILFCWVD